MELMTAFGAMLSDVSAVNASRRQVGGILAWHGHAGRAAAHAAGLSASAACLDVPFASAGTHRTWRMSSKAILAALSAQAEEAARRRASSDRQAAAGDARAAAAEAAGDHAAAGEHREAARQARAHSRELLAWEVAARDAHGTGEAVLAAEEPAAARVGEAIAAAGGLGEIPAGKRYLTRDGSPRPAGAR